MMIGGGASGLAGRCMRSALRSSAAASASKTPTTAHAWQRAISFSAVRMHGADDHDHDHDHDFVPIGKKHGVPVTHASAAPTAPHTHDHAHDHDHDHGHEHDHDHGSDDDDDDSDDEDMVDTVAVGPSGIEYGGPQRGGQFKEPTRFGDWERKGRCTDF